MLITLKRLLILLSVIGLATAALVTVVNNTSGNEFFPAGRPEQFQPGQSMESRPQSVNEPEFRGERSWEPVGGSFADIELLKNLGIITGITVVIVIIRKILVKLKSFRPATNS